MVPAADEVWGSDLRGCRTAVAGLVALLVLVGAASASAATYNVNNTSDAVAVNRAVN